MALAAQGRGKRGRVAEQPLNSEVMSGTSFIRFPRGDTPPVPTFRVCAYGKRRLPRSPIRVPDITIKHASTATRTVAVRVSLVAPDRSCSFWEAQRSYASKTQLSSGLSGVFQYVRILNVLGTGSRFQIDHVVVGYSRFVFCRVSPFLALYELTRTTKNDGGATAPIHLA
jgi:hypothetical protein